MKNPFYKKTTFHLVALLCAATALTSSCRSEEPEPVPEEIPKVAKGLFILNEGGMGGNSSTLDYYNFGENKLYKNVFQTANQDRRDANGQLDNKLGDVGNDVQIYGSKMYLVINGSNKVEVVEAKTVKSIKKVRIGAPGARSEPRYISFYKDKAFISAYDDHVYVLDTASLEIVKSIRVGADPEQMVVIDDKLYVANSGGLDAVVGLPYARTVSVIDLASLQEIKKIDVAINLECVAADQAGNLYVTSRGNYDDIAPKLFVLDPLTGTVKNTLEMAVSNLIVQGDYAYVVGYDYIESKAVYKKLNIKTWRVEQENLITDGTDREIDIPYAFILEPGSGDMYFTNLYTFPGKLHGYDKSGKKKFSQQLSGDFAGSFALFKD